ncbi:MAG TPA: sigma factor-like helix-turn-helix DNA-binding protein [Vicinamibacterales bacterium]|nr:sigma factor-like helix-turn-helix DNA-binding protein [Vicinamibacterales bacterium]
MPRDGRLGALTAQGFHALLARLDPDPERAAAGYESLRLALTRFFDWRGDPFPDEAADEVLDRMARRIAEGEPVQNLRLYALGTARLVRLERLRDPSARSHSLEEARAWTIPAAADVEADSALQSCLDRCLEALPADARTVIVRYYMHERSARIAERARLASELGLTPSAMRNRAQRIRDRLEECVRGCVGASHAGDRPRSPDTNRSPSAPYEGSELSPDVRTLK